MAANVPVAPRPERIMIPTCPPAPVGGLVIRATIVRLPIIGRDANWNSSFSYHSKPLPLGDVPEMVYSPFWYVVPVPENGPPTSSAVQPDGKGLAPGVAIVRDASIVLLTESLDPLSLNN